MCSIMVHLYLYVYWPSYLYLKWVRMRRSRLYIMKRILNMCIGAYVHVCLIMCVYRCLCLWIWLYDMLRRGNLGNYAPLFKVIKNVCRPLLVKRVIFLVSFTNWSRIGCLYIWMVAYNLRRWLLSKVMNVIVYDMCLLNSPMLSLRVIPILCKCMIMRLDLHMLIIMFHTFNPRTWYVQIYLIICETLALEWYEQF